MGRHITRVKLEGKLDGLRWVLQNRKAPGESRIRITTDMEDEIIAEMSRVESLLVGLRGEDSR